MILIKGFSGMKLFSIHYLHKPRNFSALFYLVLFSRILYQISNKVSNQPIRMKIIAKIMDAISKQKSFKGPIFSLAKQM